MSTRPLSGHAPVSNKPVSSKPAGWCGTPPLPSNGNNFAHFYPTQSPEGVWRPLDCFGPSAVRLQGNLNKSQSGTVTVEFDPTSSQRASASVSTFPREIAEQFVLSTGQRLDLADSLEAHLRTGRVPAADAQLFNSAIVALRRPDLFARTEDF